MGSTFGQMVDGFDVSDFLESASPVVKKLLDERSTALSDLEKSQKKLADARSLSSFYGPTLTDTYVSDAMSQIARDTDKIRKIQDRLEDWRPLWF